MAGSTILSLTNRVLRHFNEVQLTSTTFPTATGFQLACQDYVNESIREIQQSEYEWPFNWNQSTQPLTVGIAPNEYALPVTCESVDWESFQLKGDLTLTPPTQQKYIPYKDYDYWLQNDAANAYNQILNIATSPLAVQTPTYVYRSQSLTFGFDLPSDQIYNVTYEWWGYPTELTLYSDTTTIPSRFDHIIFKGALKYGYLFRGNMPVSEAWADKQEKGIEKMRELLINRFKVVRDNRLRRAG